MIVSTLGIQYASFMHERPLLHAGAESKGYSSRLSGAALVVGGGPLSHQRACPRRRHATASWAYLLRLIKLLLRLIKLLSSPPPTSLAIAPRACMILNKLLLLLLLLLPVLGVDAPIASTTPELLNHGVAAKRGLEKGNKGKAYATANQSCQVSSDATVGGFNRQRALLIYFAYSQGTGTGWSHLVGNRASRVYDSK